MEQPQEQPALSAGVKRKREDVLTAFLGFSLRKAPAVARNLDEQDSNANAAATAPVVAAPMPLAAPQAVVAPKQAERAQLPIVSPPAALTPAAAPATAARVPPTAAGAPTSPIVTPPPAVPAVPAPATGAPYAAQAAPAPVADPASAHAAAPAPAAERLQPSAAAPAAPAPEARTSPPAPSAGTAPPTAATAAGEALELNPAVAGVVAAAVASVLPRRFRAAVRPRAWAASFQGSRSSLAWVFDLAGTHECPFAAGVRHRHVPSSAYVVVHGPYAQLRCNGKGCKYLAGVHRPLALPPDAASAVGNWTPRPAVPKGPSLTAAAAAAAGAAGASGAPAAPKAPPVGATAAAARAPHVGSSTFPQARSSHAIPGAASSGNPLPGDATHPGGARAHPASFATGPLRPPQAAPGPQAQSAARNPPQKPHSAADAPKLPRLTTAPKPSSSTGFLLPIPRPAIPVSYAPGVFPSEVLKGRRTLSPRETPDLWQTLSLVASLPSSLAPFTTGNSANIVKLARLALPSHGWASNSVLKSAIIARHRGFCLLLHPDRWNATWATARAAIPSNWAGLVELDAPAAAAAPSAVPPAAIAPGTAAGASKPRWTEPMLQVAAVEVFHRIQAAYEGLNVT